MKKYIQVDSYYVETTLKILLEDKTRKENIIWATNSYSHLGEDFSAESSIKIEHIRNSELLTIQPRIFKDIEKQAERTREKAEVFTPAWVCNKMNNYCDEEWFGYKDVFNHVEGETWHTNEGKIQFPENKNWKKYIDSRRLEITCGEAPYLVSRYDASSGEMIPVSDRIGMLDRKLRIVNENLDEEQLWLKWVERAFQSVYGYEFQGDNLLIARINLLMTFVDYLKERWHREPTEKELKHYANIISWNIWQMDGLTYTIPFGTPEEELEQTSLFDLLNEEPVVNENITPICKIYDWRLNNSILFTDLKKARQL